MKVCQAPYGAFALVIAALSGCQGEEEPSLVLIEAGAPVMDASTLLDAAEAEAAVDAGVEPPPQEAGAGVGDCTGDVLSFRVANTGERSFAALLDQNRLHVAYLVPSCGSEYARPNTQALDYVSFGTTGAPSEPSHLAGSVDDEQCGTVRAPALLSGSDGLELYYTSDLARLEDGTRSFSLELFRQGATPANAPVQLSQTTDVELHTRAINFAPEQPAVVAYVAQQGVHHGQPAAIRVWRAEGGHVEVLSSASMHRPTQLAFAVLGSTAEEPSGVLAWVSDGEGAAGVYLQRITAVGQAQAAPELLSARVGAASSVALAMHGAGGAVLYTELGPTGHELRFRRIDEHSALGTTSALTRGNEDVREAALVGYTNGYVIAYRRAPAEGSASGSIQLLFVNEQGTPAGTRFVAETAPASGLDVLVAADGRILVLWVDPEHDGDGSDAQPELHLRVARLTCL